FPRGSILRGKFADLKSPIAYGYDGSDLPVYFNQDPVLNAAAAGLGFGGFGGFGGGGRGGANAMAQNVTPNAVPIHVSPLDPGMGGAPEPAAPAGGGGRGGRGGGAGGGGRGDFAAAPAERPRVVVQFPSNANDMLLSGTLAGGEALANRALA